MENPYHLEKAVPFGPDGEPLGPGEGGPPLDRMENLYHQGDGGRSGDFGPGGPGSPGDLSGPGGPSPEQESCKRL